MIERIAAKLNIEKRRAEMIITALVVLLVAICAVPATRAMFEAGTDIDVRVRNEVISIDREKKTVKVRDLAEGTEYAYKASIYKQNGKYYTFADIYDKSICTYNTPEILIFILKFVVYCNIDFYLIIDNIFREFKIRKSINKICVILAWR